MFGLNVSCSDKEIMDFLIMHLYILENINLKTLTTGHLI